MPPEIPAEAVQAAARTLAEEILASESDEALARLILEAAAPYLAEHALRSATRQQHEEMVGRLAAEAIERERPKLLAAVEQVADEAIAKRAATIAAQARASERERIAAHLRAIPDDDKGPRTGIGRFIDRHDRLHQGTSITAVLLAAADEIED